MGILLEIEELKIAVLGYAEALGTRSDHIGERPGESINAAITRHYNDMSGLHKRLIKDCLRERLENEDILSPNDEKLLDKIDAIGELIEQGLIDVKAVIELTKGPEEEHKDEMNGDIKAGLKP